MDRLTLLSMKPIAARVIGVCATDARIPLYLNEAQERLMSKGRWVGTVIRYRICTSESCITLPRQIETVEAWALCDCPLTVRDKWYEFAANGPGQRRSDLGSSMNMIDRGTACVYQDMSGTTSFINVQSAVAEAVDARILLRGYDDNAQWIRTQEPAASGIWIDGEYVAINTTGTRSVNKFSSLTEAIKPVTNGPVNLFEWPAALGANFQQIAYYESDETLPIYRRYLIPNIANACKCNNAQDDCASKTVTILAKLRHIPVSNDNDFLVLQNRSALKLMIQAILKEERNVWNEATVYEARAVQELENELGSHEGDGPVSILRIIDPDLFGANVENEQESRLFYHTGMW
jgi:hypothetical protein